MTNSVPPVLVQAAVDLKKRLTEQQGRLEKEVQGLEMKLTTTKGQLAEATDELEMLEQWLLVHAIPTWTEEPKFDSA